MEKINKLWEIVKETIIAMLFVFSAAVIMIGIFSMVLVGIIICSIIGWSIISTFGFIVFLFLCFCVIGAIFK